MLGICPLQELIPTVIGPDLYEHMEWREASSHQMNQNRKLRGTPHEL